MSTRTILAVIVVVSLATSLGWTATQARVSGKVTDLTGTPISKAKITITSAELPTYTKEITTDGKGRYKVLILDATKTYNFHFEATGYGPLDQSVKVGVGSMDNDINVSLYSQQQVLDAQKDQLRAQPGYKELEEAYELIERGQEAEGRAKLQAAVDVLPDLAQGWTVLSELDFELGDYQAAYDHARRCLELDDESSSCLAVAANSAGKLGKVDEQQEYMALFHELNPDDPATIFNEAVPYLNAMDDENARPILEKCLDVDPTFPKCLYEYALMLLRTGDMEGAKAKLQQYLEVAPDGMDAATAAETIKYL